MCFDKNKYVSYNLKWYYPLCLFRHNKDKKIDAYNQDARFSQSAHRFLKTDMCFDKKLIRLSFAVRFRGTGTGIGEPTQSKSGGFPYVTVCIFSQLMQNFCRSTVISCYHTAYIAILVLSQLI